MNSLLDLCHIERSRTFGCETWRIVSSLGRELDKSTDLQAARRRCQDFNGFACTRCPVGLLCRP